MLIDMDKIISYEHFKKIMIIKDLGHNLSPESVILDFGCGSGKMVKELCELGYNAFGCGTRFNIEENVDTEALMSAGILRTIDLKNYRLPFEDNTFDFIYSHSVFEHVQNYSESLSEIVRVLKPEGFCLHIFPSRYRLMEQHVFVPFSSVIKSYWWLNLWISLGIRKNEWQDYKSVSEQTLRYYNYLKEETNYLSKSQLVNQFRMQFKDVIFCENLFNKYSPRRGKYLYTFSKIFPFIPSLYSTFHTRVIFTGLPYKTLKSDIVSQG
jgi:ubiquinone/menaquinone biosynthesis C-methylase UbiE